MTPKRIKEVRLRLDDAGECSCSCHPDDVCLQCCSPDEQTAADLRDALDALERVTSACDKVEVYKGPLGVPGSPLFGAGMAEAYRDMTNIIRAAIAGSPAEGER